MKAKTIAAIGLMAFATIIVSCNQNQIVPSDNESSPLITKLSNVESQKSFARVLSKAVSNNEDVRNFIKKEAIAQFDNDYDVFYPFAKSKEVSEGKTFRDILVSYSSEEEIAQIEESSLLLNILVPDLTLFWDFRAENWDVSNSEVAIVCRDDNDNSLFYNGEIVGNLPMDEVPAFPCVVVKNNERLRISNKGTRAENAVYEFIDAAYDSSKTGALTRHSSWDDPLEETDGAAYTTDLDQSVIDAYNASKSSDGDLLQRDYIYYGIGKSNQSGKLKRNIFEEIRQFKVSVYAFPNISDQDGDPGLAGKKDAPKKTWWGVDEIVKQMWTDGSFEIVFKTYTPLVGSTSPRVKTLRFSLPAKELFSIEKIHIDYKNKTAFRPFVASYSVDPKMIRGRWVYPSKIKGKGEGSQVFTDPWDLYNTSMVIDLNVLEEDGDETIEVTTFVSGEFASKADFGVELGPVKIGGGFSGTTTESYTLKTTTKKGSDELGTVTLDFRKPVIVGHDNTLGYKLHSVSAGDVEVVFVPTKL